MRFRSIRKNWRLFVAYITGGVVLSTAISLGAAGIAEAGRTNLAMSADPIFLQDEIKKWIPKWWQRFADDKKRGKDNVFCLPCNLEKEGNPNSGRLNFTIPQKSAILVSVVNSIAYKADNDERRET